MKDSLVQKTHHWKLLELSSPDGQAHTQGLVVGIHGAQTIPQLTSYDFLIVLTTLDTLNLFPPPLCSFKCETGLGPPQCQKKGVPSPLCGEASGETSQKQCAELSFKR